MAVTLDPRRGEAPQDSAAALSERSGVGAAAAVAPMLGLCFVDELPVTFRFWDGSETGPTSGPGTVEFRDPDGLRRLVWSPDELGLARAFVSGAVEVTGDIIAVLRELHDAAVSTRRLRPGALFRGLRSVVGLGLISRPPPPPAIEVRVRGFLHSKHRDAQAIAHHYDVGNDFYRLVLGPSMTYSCARFAEEGFSLEQAQFAKHDLICRKLGLDERRGARLLDVGCGWGEMAMHAAANYGAHVVAITISAAQAELAIQRVREAGLEDLVEVRVQDYRDLAGETFDAISSIGMFEHVGARRIKQYFDTLVPLLAPGGRLLNHAISKPGGSRMHGRMFIHRYVFPDGELIDVADVVGAIERSGLEVRDVESFREHYTETLRCWVANLERSFDDAVALVGSERARVWRLYMAASANSFEDGGIAVHQVLAVKDAAGGVSEMPRSRAAWG